MRNGIVHGPRSSSEGDLHEKRGHMVSRDNAVPAYLRDSPVPYQRGVHRHIKTEPQRLSSITVWTRVLEIADGLHKTASRLQKQ